MLALRSAISKKLILKPSAVMNFLSSGAHSSMAMIGSREIVGGGMNGEPIYVDSTMFPYPAVRFKEITSSLKALKEKEKGNWKSLTKSEKKCLYRMSFCQTLAEVDAPSSEWKSILSSLCLFVAAGIWFFVFQQYLIKKSGVKLPDSFSEERQVAQLKRMLDLRVGIIDGLSSRPEYQKYIKESEEDDD